MSGFRRRLKSGAALRASSITQIMLLNIFIIEPFNNRSCCRSFIGANVKSIRFNVCSSGPHPKCFPAPEKMAHGMKH